MKKILIFASGTGTNAEAILNHFENRKDLKVNAILSNNKNAKVLTMAKNRGVKPICFTREEFYQTTSILDYMKEVNPDLIVLAGFLWIIPQNIIEAFPQKIINIHPSLLPKYGGKGMYGDRVHRAVLENNEFETGISIHYVNEHYDEGELIAQFKTKLDSDDKLPEVIKKIRMLEHSNYPKVIENLLFSTQ